MESSLNFQMKFFLTSFKHSGTFERIRDVESKDSGWIYGMQSKLYLLMPLYIRAFFISREHA